MSHQQVTQIVESEEARIEAASWDVLTEEVQS